MSNCEHKDTIMWEPHLAGARKCKDCSMVYNPNMGGWHVEAPSQQEIIEKLEFRLKSLNKLLDVLEGHDFGYSYEECQIRIDEVEGLLYTIRM